MTVTNPQIRRIINLCLLIPIALFCSVLLFVNQPALAGINDDRYDGNVYVVYAGNGSLVPPRSTLAQSLEKEKPAVLIFYMDDSSDCKQFAIIVSRIQEFYGRAANLIPIAIDSISSKSDWSPAEAGYYYEDAVPQTVIIDQKGEVAYNGKGQVKYEEIDDALREVFGLLPRTESAELKRRPFNEFNSGLAN